MAGAAVDQVLDRALESGAQAGIAFDFAFVCPGAVEMGDERARAEAIEEGQRIKREMGGDEIGACARTASAKARRMSRKRRGNAALVGAKARMAPAVSAAARPLPAMRPETATPAAGRVRESS